MPNDFLEWSDIYKALFSIGAGIILGLERELKDKKAGLKTISIICLGSTLFAILSKKVGGEANAGQIAAYIVSGVGFIGAGAIFKDKLTISGLTTAGIIWIAAAVGTSIGFGEYYTAAIFLTASYISVILIPNLIGRFTSKNTVFQIKVTFKNGHPDSNTYFKTILGNNCSFIEVKRMEYRQEHLIVIYDVMTPSLQIDALVGIIRQEEIVEQFEIN